MLFGVVVCPHCKRVQVVDASAMRTRCRACEQGFETGTRKRFYLGEDAEEARRVAARVSLLSQGAGVEAIAQTVAALDAERSLSVDDVVARLGRLEEFTLADVEDELLRARLTTTAARLVEGLRQSDRLYEPRPGRYRWIL